MVIHQNGQTLVSTYYSANHLMLCIALTLRSVQPMKLSFSRRAKFETLKIYMYIATKLYNNRTVLFTHTLQKFIQMMMILPMDVYVNVRWQNRTEKCAYNVFEMMKPVKILNDKQLCPLKSLLKDIWQAYSGTGYQIETRPRKVVPTDSFASQHTGQITLVW